MKKKYYCYVDREGKLQFSEVKEERKDYENNPFIAISIGYIEASSLEEIEKKSKYILNLKLGGLK